MSLQEEQTMAESNAPGMIEGLERLKIPQSSFTLNRRARPPPIDVQDGQEEPRIPLNPMKLHRQESKGGIRGIFNRNKAEKTPLASTLEDGTSMPAVSEMPMKAINYESLDKNTTLPQQVASPMPVTPSKPLNKPSRMNLRSKPTKESKPSPKPSTKSPSRPTRTSAAWDPPPLFQAYPQAIKHAQVATSTLSADSILRISNHKRNNSITDYNTISANGDEKEMAAAVKKTEKAKMKHKRQMSGSISKAVMMIVTSGHILQYGSEGNFDRLPEKMMLLGKDSVAFASDVIPGKHWVLQISQSMDAEGKATSDSRSLLSRLAFRGADYRRTATSLLLILDSAEEMDSWIAVVRREIEALGGKKYVSDSVNPRSDEQLVQLRERPSHRYLVQKDPDQFSNPASPSHLSFGPAPWNQANLREKDTDPVLDWNHPSVRALSNHQSATNSIVSHDGQTLDELKRNSAHIQRFSYMSSGQRTSLDSSPTRDGSLSAFEDTTPKVSIDESRPRPNASAINERRRSMQNVPLLALESQTPKTHRHSTYGGSTTTPNFSVPNTSSRRFSTVKNHTVLPGIGITSLRSDEPVLKGMRKSPPPAITVARPLSPVADDLSPIQEVMKIAPAESQFNSLQQITASVIDIAPRSPLHMPSPLEDKFPQQTVTPPLPQFNSKTTSPPTPSHLNFKFPRPVSMVETSREKPDLPSKNENRKSLLVPDKRTPQMLDLEKERIAPLPVIANTKTKLRRPVSMQIRPTFTTGAFAGLQSRVPGKMSPPVSSTSQISQANKPLSVPTKARANSPALKPTTPSLQRLKQEKTLRDRRSLPFLVGGPPPAPPPNCALPPLPPSSALRNGSSASNRRSVKV